ncbi:MAG: RluA family pseudouridine synthase [Candidatus Omnitrophica bacterium]|nr:RluA family pseudouridine synthase [Candidatus Omnitrophota bacterium]
MKKPFEVIFEDEYLIVIDKIAKLVVQPSPKKEKNTLTSVLERTVKVKLYPCHRLDKETTGLIIYAKSKTIQKEFMEKFKKGQVKKKYFAFVKDKLKKKKGFFEGYILDKEGRRFGEKPKKAKTFYRVLKEYLNFSIVELEPFTGRRNQLRIQLARIGNPILGEDKYAFRRDFQVNFRRLALHAFFISFIHPVSGNRIDLRIDLPQDMKDFLRLHKISYPLLSEKIK